jgi:GNAT superfamily N-acetyltransferase
MTDTSPGLVVHEVTGRDRDWMLERLRERWGASATIVAAGRRHDLRELPALVALLDGDRAGIATYRVEGDECELVTLDAFAERRGVGSALLEAVAALARERGCRRLWLITTNDNLEALRFYQRRGLRLVAVRRDAVAQARRLKPEIPPDGADGIPILDEIELELRLR